MNSFTASAMGCNRPRGPTVFGPLQSCIYPSTFHLISVRNAKASGVGITNEIMLIINIF